MNRKQRVEMIVKILLLPFTCDPFSTKDLLLEKVRAYQQMTNSEDAGYSSKYTAYRKAQEVLVRSIQSKVHLERLSEAEELVETFYPESQLEQHLNQYGNLDAQYLERLLQLSTEFITLRDGIVSIKMWAEEDIPRQTRRELFPPHSGLYKVELWSEISRVITPDVLIAGYFVQCGIEDCSFLKNLPDNISLSDSILARANQKGIAETHMHLSAGMSYLSVWEAVTDLTALRPTKPNESSLFQQQQETAVSENGALIIAGWLRLLLARYLLESHPDDGDILPFYQSRIVAKDGAFECRLLNCILHEDAKSEILALLEEFNQKRGAYCAYLRDAYQVEAGSRELDLLAHGLYAKYASLHTSPELLLLYFSLWHVRKFPNHQVFIQAFLCYLRIKNNYFCNRIQADSVSGLTFFRRYFRQAGDSWKGLQSREDLQKTQMIFRASFRNQFHCANLKKLEVKITPPPNLSPISVEETRLTKDQDMRQIARQLLNVISAYLDTMDEVGMSGNIPTLGIVYHLLRPDIQHPSRKMCWAYPADQRPTDQISRIRSQSIRFLHALQALLQKVPGLPELVVGLDAASEELYASPWVYAPVYHAARNRENTVPIQLSSGQPMQNIGLTYHVGEDYHHVLSGLRHIDEVLTHFGYKAGDRIGHGLVLQIDMEEWVHNHEVVSVPVLEYLEDLLWVWGLCRENTADLSAFLPSLELEIMHIAEDLYQNIRGLSPYVLWRAYYAKFQPLSTDFCNAMYSAYLTEPQLQPASSPTLFPAQRSFCVLVGDQTSVGCTAPHIDAVWDSDKLLMTHYCPVYAPHYRKPHFIHNSRTLLPLLQTVQVHVRKKVQNMGIFVETNPTSNLMIGDISGLHDSPVIKLNTPTAKGPDPAEVLISINSDDPLIFNTNVENELALVYHMLDYHGYSREISLQWMDKVRQYGMDSSFIRKVRTPDEQREFLTGLQKHLSDIIRGV